MKKFILSIILMTSPLVMAGTGGPGPGIASSQVNSQISASTAGLKSAILNAEQRKAHAEEQARQQAAADQKKIFLYRCVSKALRAKSEEIYSQESSFREESGLNLIFDALRRYEERHPEKGEFWIFNRFWEMNKVSSSKEKVRSALVEVGMFESGDTVAINDLSKVLTELRQFMKRNADVSICGSIYSSRAIELYQNSRSNLFDTESRTCKSLKQVKAPCKSSEYGINTIFYLKRSDLLNL